MLPASLPTRRRLVLVGLLLVLGGCVSAPPENRDDICAIFQEKGGWYKDAKRASKRWGAPIPVMMSFMHQESSFVARAKPPRKKILWIIPGPRPASAKGYSQAINETWAAYQKSTGRWTADRNHFDDAIDFMGWYIDQSHRTNRIDKGDAYNGYLAYHEGQGGFARRSFAGKNWLLDAARTVSNRSNTYTTQLNGCRKSLDRGWLLRLLPFF